MSKFNTHTSKYPKGPFHQTFKSSTDSDFQNLNIDELYTISESSSQKQSCNKPIFKTLDSRDLHITDSDSSSKKRCKSKSTADDDHLKSTMEPKISAKILKQKINKNSSLLQEQDEIIKMQCNLIESLKKEIHRIKRQKIASETPSNADASLKNENLKLVRKIEALKSAHKCEVEKILKGIHKNEEAGQEFKIEMNMKLEKKSAKIRALKEKVESVREYYDKACKNAFEELKFKLEQVTKDKISGDEERIVLKDKEKMLMEENTILVQNYEEARLRYGELEKQMLPITEILKNFRKKNIDLRTLVERFEDINSENKELSRKCMESSDMLSAVNTENSELKAKLSKIELKYLDIATKKGKDSENERLQIKLKRKCAKIAECKQKLLEYKNKLAEYTYKQENKNKLTHHLAQNSLELEDQMSVIEEELNLLRTENRILVSKEQDLSAKLKSSENARYFYQEQTISLKEKVNELENQLKVIYSYEKPPRSSEGAEKEYKLARSNTVKALKKLLKS